MSSPRPGVESVETTYHHVDEIDWTPVQRQRNADGTESAVREQWPVMHPRCLSAHVHYDPGMVVRRHGHRSEHVVVLLNGGAWIGDDWCTTGAHVHVPLGATFGPIIAGPEGVTRMGAFDRSEMQTWLGVLRVASQPPAPAMGAGSTLAADGGDGGAEAENLGTGVGTD